MSDSLRFPGYVAAIPVLATFATLQAGASAPTSLAAQLLMVRPLQYLGGISYSLYLWHWPVLMIAREIYPDNSVAVRTACVLLSFLLAAATHITVENPIRFNLYLVSRSLLSLGLVGLSMMICVGGLAMWRLHWTIQQSSINSTRYAMTCRPCIGRDAGPTQAKRVHEYALSGKPPARKRLSSFLEIHMPPNGSRR